jgi:hypothetical protein
VPVRLFAGDDWAGDHHDIEVMDEAGKVLAKRRLPEGVAGMTQLHALIGRFLPEDADDAEVVIGIETDRGPWVAAENACLIGPAGTGKSHVLVALGVAAVQAGHKVRYYTAAELVETFYRALADNSVGRVIETMLRCDLIICDELGFAPLDDTGAQVLFRFVAAAYERRSLGIGSHWPFESWGRFLPEHTTAVSMLDRLLHHCHVVITDGDSYRMKQARARGGSIRKTS